MSECAYAVFRPFPLTPKPAFLPDPGGFLGAHDSSGWVNSCEEFVMCIGSSHILNSEVPLRATITPDTTPNTISLIKKRVRAATPSQILRQILSVSVEHLSQRPGCRTSLRYIPAYSSQDVSYFGWEIFVHKILCVSLIHPSDSGFFFGDKGVCEKPQSSCMLDHLPPGPQDMFLSFWGVVPGFRVLFELHLVIVVSFTDLNLLALGNPVNQSHRLS